MVLLSVFLATFMLLGSTFVLSLWWTVFQYTPIALRAPHASGPLKVAVVLGSGGHTSEMLLLIRSLPTHYWASNRPFYVVSDSDTHSAGATREQELRLYGRNAVFRVIPRAREVGQSYSSSIFTTLKATCKSFRVVAEERPEVLLTNGPGVCVPIIAASILLATVLPWWYRRPAIVYFESFTCVRHVSLTGRLVAPFIADVFTVCWRSLQPAVHALRRRPKGEGWGGLFYIGPPGNSDGGRGEGAQAAEESAELSAQPLEADDSPASGFDASTGAEGGHHEPKFALVTVGSTRFDKLVNAMAKKSVCRTLNTKFGITRLLLQYGTSDFTLSSSAGVLKPGETGGNAGLLGSSSSSSQPPPAGPKLKPKPATPPLSATEPAAAAAATSAVQEGVSEGVTITAFRYKSGLSRLVRRAALVVTHAGAGTILECLQAHVPTVVVPNRDLMSDHQLELAEALADGNHLFYTSVEEVGERLGTLDVAVLHPHEGIDKAALRRVMALPLTGRLERE